jgi:hypothetical protein
MEERVVKSDAPKAYAQIDRLLRDIASALARLSTRTDAATFEMLGKLRAREFASLRVEARAGLEPSAVVVRLEALRSEIDCRLEPH